jgi:hypothetical protein
MHALVLALMFTSQVQPWGVSPSPAQAAEQHRLAIEQQRVQAQQRELFARQQDLNTRLTLRDIEAARQPAVAPASPRPLGSPEAERLAREAQTRRTDEVRNGVGQIESWLDRTRPD